jgi:hypothetical protein
VRTLRVALEDGATVSRAGRRARRERLAAAGLWDAPAPRRQPQPVLHDRPRPAPLAVLAGARRLGWLWEHRADGYPWPAMLANWQRALESMQAEARTRKAAAPITRRRAA